jgi:hypothetical protein
MHGVTIGCCIFFVQYGSHRFDRVNHFIVFRKSAYFFFGKDHLAIGDYIKDAPRSFDQFRVNIQFLLNRIRQTGGFG